MFIKNSNHIVLDNPQDMGNIGTIIRTMLGFGIKDLAIIGRKIDFFNPKVVRASMGAIFKINIQYFENLNDYLEQFNQRDFYCFMLGDRNQKNLQDVKKFNKYSLIFGNEAKGLSDDYQYIGHNIIINQTKDVDSLNITTAASVAMFWFTKDSINKKDIL